MEEHLLDLGRVVFDGDLEAFQHFLETILSRHGLHCFFGSHEGNLLIEVGSDEHANPNQLRAREVERPQYILQHRPFGLDIHIRIAVGEFSFPGNRHVPNHNTGAEQ